jgi:hypothetical protein
LREGEVEEESQLLFTIIIIAFTVNSNGTD